MEKAEAKALLSELIAIKKLMMLTASKLGASQPEIGKTLGVTSRQVRRILGKKKVNSDKGREKKNGTKAV